MSSDILKATTPTEVRALSYVAGLFMGIRYARALHPVVTIAPAAIRVRATMRSKIVMFDPLLEVWVYRRTINFN